MPISTIIATIHTYSKQYLNSCTFFACYNISFMFLFSNKLYLNLSYLDTWIPVNLEKKIWPEATSPNNGIFNFRNPIFPRPIHGPTHTPFPSTFPRPTCPSVLSPPPLRPRVRHWLIHTLASLGKLLLFIFVAYCHCNFSIQWYLGNFYFSSYF